MLRAPRLLWTIVWTISAVAVPAAAVEPPDVTVVERGKTVRIETGVATVDVARTPFHVKVRDRVNGKRLVRGARGGMLGYERGASSVMLGDVTAVTPLADGATL